MSYQLLIVDDEFQSRNLLCSCFPWESISFHVAGQADNGLEALQFLQNNPVDVILCDIQMPICSGIELAQKLSTWINPPLIVFLSGHRDFEYAREAISYGVRFYIVKPARFEELSEVFTTIKCELDSNHKSEIDTVNEIEDPFVKRVKNYCETDFRTATLSEIASILYMNSSYVSQLFKSKTGINFTDYLLKVRMNNAAELLQNLSFKIYDISNQIGYTNPKNFARSFHNFYNQTPREFREAYQYSIKKGDINAPS